MDTWQDKFAKAPTAQWDGDDKHQEELLDDSQWDIVFAIHQRLLEDIDDRTLSELEPDRAREAVEKAARTLSAEIAPQVAGMDRDALVARVADEVLGYGPIDGLLKDPTVTEVMVNAPNVIYYEQDGLIKLSNVRFRDAQQIRRVAERIISPLGRRVDESSPYVDARLPDGSRVNIIIPPVSPKSPVITIRKFRADMFTMADLASAGTLTPALADLFEGCVKGRLNILISGGAGSGKTTLLNALSAYIPATERIVTIEDPAELKMQQPHCVTLEARPPNLEGKHEVTQRDLVRNSLRMRPDRIVVGEVRGGEAFDMMQAMNTGHEGSMSTIHANSPRDALMRAENMILMAGFDLPIRFIREQMSSALHVVIQLARFIDGSRKVVSVAELTGMESQTITMQEIFRFNQEGIDASNRVLGQLVATGIQPRFTESLEKAGIHLPDNMFSVAERW